MTLLYSCFIDVERQYVVRYQRTAEDRPSVCWHFSLLIKHFRRHVNWTQLAPYLPRQYVVGIVTDISLDEDGGFFLILKYRIKNILKFL